MRQVSTLRCGLGGRGQDGRGLGRIGWAVAALVVVTALCGPVDSVANTVDAVGRRVDAEQKTWRLPVQPAKDSVVPLVYTSNLNGELEPCGCSTETHYGGIQRRGQVVSQLRKLFNSAQQEVLLLSAGGLLEDSGGVSAIKNTAILKGMQLMDYDAIGMQARDLLYGVNFIVSTTLPWINSTALPAASLPASYKEASGEIFQPFADHISVSRDNTDFAIFSVMPPQALFPVMDTQGKQAALTEAYSKTMAKVTEKVIEKIESENIIILMSSVPAKILKNHINFQLIDVLITPARNEHFVPPQWLGDTLWLQPGNRGMHMGVAQLKLTGFRRTLAKPDPHSGLNLPVQSYSVQMQRQIELVSHEVIGLDDQVPNDQALVEWYADYNAQVARAYGARSALEKKYTKGERRFHGVAVCAGCHKAIAEHWQKTDHSKAFQTLEHKNKAFDPGCLKCHTVAFHQPGGFIDMDVSKHLANVQCESCHIDASEHITTPEAFKPKLAEEAAEQVCTQCHDKAHSPSFNYESYWQRIDHSP